MLNKNRRKDFVSYAIAQGLCKKKKYAGKFQSSFHVTIAQFLRLFWHHYKGICLRLSE